MEINWPPADTSPEAAWRQVEVYRRMTPEQRFVISCEMNDALCARVANGVRQRHPELSDEEVRLAVIRICLGDELFSKAFPGVKVPR